MTGKADVAEQTSSRKKRASSAGLTSSQFLYRELFDELPKRDMTETELPKLFSVFDTLTARERRIIEMRFGFGYEMMPRPAIGEELGVSADRVKQVELKALKKLRHESRARHIRPLFLTYEDMETEIAKRDMLIASLQQDLLIARSENAKFRSAVKKLSETFAPLPIYTTQPTSEILDMTIEELDLSVRAYNCLKRAGIHTMQDLIDKREVEVTKIRNLGKKSLKEVLDKVKEMGLKFRD